MSTEDEVIILRKRVAYLEEKIQFLYQHFQLAFPGDAQGQPPEIRQMMDYINKGNLIEAIKIHRAVYGTSLAEAKEAVEQMRGGRR